MRRTVLLSPLALLTSACTSTAPSAWTPATTTAYWGTSENVRDYEFPAEQDAVRRWQLPPDDPWSVYAKYTLLTSLDAAPQQVELPDVSNLGEVQRAEIAARQVASEGLPPDTLWVVDMRGAASVAFGATLSQYAREPVSVVPTFNNWPAADELVPAEETLAALTTMSPRLTPDATEASRPVFLLDSWRLAYRFDEPDDDTYDNRYILSQSDLPDVATLRANGIRRVVYLVQNAYEDSVEEDDLHATFLEWQRAGILIAMVDLDALYEPILPDRWPQVWLDDGLLIEPRVTLLERRHFYERARGGFGGIGARPSPVRFGGLWTVAGAQGGHGGHGGHGGGG
jgi:hypothetical protein